MFTQRDEEKYILKFFKDKPGRFLDIGAFDGECFSTTRALALKGWGGVCVEPSPSILPALHQRYDSRKDVEILEVAITDSTGEVDFYDSGGDMISTVNKEHMELWHNNNGSPFTTVRVKSLTPADLFARTGMEFDFISLDVEGTNVEIFQQFPFEDLNRVKMICVEFDMQVYSILETVKKFGFILLHQTHENLLLVKE